MEKAAGKPPFCWTKFCWSSAYRSTKSHSACTRQLLLLPSASAETNSYSAATRTVFVSMQVSFTGAMIHASRISRSFMAIASPFPVSGDADALHYTATSLLPLPSTMSISVPDDVRQNTASRPGSELITFSTTSPQEAPNTGYHTAINTGLLLDIVLLGEQSLGFRYRGKLFSMTHRRFTFIYLLQIHRVYLHGSFCPFGSVPPGLPPTAPKGGFRDCFRKTLSGSSSFP